MKINTILEMISSNRDFLMQNSGIALDNLQALHKNFDSETDEACIMSLALNDSIAAMRFHSDYEKAIDISGKIVARFSNSSQPYFVASHLKITGRCMALLGQFDASESNLNAALDICEKQLDESSANIKLNAEILHDLAMANDKADGDPQRSLTYLEKALEMLEGTSFEVLKGICLMGMGILKHNIGANKEALEYHLKAANKFDDNYHYTNLASVYNNLALCYNELGMTEEAESYLLRALDLRMTLGNKEEIAECYYNLGFFYELYQRSDEARSAMFSSHDYAMECVNKKGLLQVLDWLEKNDTEKAAEYKEERLRMVI